MKNALSWFEIPVANLDRATAFYEQALGQGLRREIFGGTPLAVFPFEAGPAEHNVGGALMFTPDRKPSDQGSIVYLDVTGKLDEVLARVPSAGGHVLMPRTHIGAPGYIAQIRDPEGNIVGLHSHA